jgi:hypothetical protein
MFQSERNIKACRKVHRCEQCDTRIQIGEPAVRISGTWDGNFYSYHVHLECHEAGLAFAKETGLWGEDFTWFNQDRERDTIEWLLEHYPIVANRMNLEVDDDE